MATSTTAGVTTGVAGTAGAPGSGAPGAQMSVTKQALLFLVVAVGGLTAFRLLFHEGERLAPMRVDVTEVIKVYLSYQAINVPMKLVAFHYHGHSFSQAILTFT